MKARLSVCLWHYNLLKSKYVVLFLMLDDKKLKLCVFYHEKPLSMSF